MTESGSIRISFHDKDGVKNDHMTIFVPWSDSSEFRTAAHDPVEAVEHGLDLVRRQARRALMREIHPEEP